MVDPKQFGKYLKELRKGRSLTTRQVEIYSGVSNSYLSLLERGKRGIPSPEILKKLSPVYKVPYKELMAMAGYLSPDPGRTNDPAPPDVSAFRSPQETRLIENYRKSDNRGRRIIEDVAEGVNVKDEEAAAKG